MAVNATKWLVVCLHYNEPWETFLSKAVRPYVDVVLQTGIAERFFYERSWEKGPHIRLWFKSTEFLLEKMLLPNLKEHFQVYFESKPSFLILPAYTKQVPDQDKWYPNNSVQVLDNQAIGLGEEHAATLSFLERQYHASSRIVLDLIKHSEGKWSQDERLGNAMKLHLSMFYACGLTLNEAQAFSVWAYQNWEAGHQNAATELGNYLEMRSSFQAAFEQQRPDLLSYLSATWELLKNYRRVENVAYIRWIHINSKTSLELESALFNKHLTPLVTPLPAPQDIWSFYADFMEKTNNRLGIIRKNEVGYLYFSLAQTLKQISQNAFSLLHSEYAHIHSS